MTTTVDRTELLAAALGYLAAGCSVVPLASDGRKMPSVTWATWQQQRPTAEQLIAWFTEKQPDGIALICGAVSGNLEMLELEGRAIDLHDQLGQLMHDNGHGNLWERLNHGHLETTPSGGFHWLYRVDGPAARNRKLARRPATADELAAKPGETVKVLIETRGEGGLTVVAPSAGRSHPTGLPWTLLHGSPATIPVISVAERDALHAIAGMLDQTPDDEPVAMAQAAAVGRHPAGRNLTRPGDDYNDRTDWADLLVPHGWTESHRVGPSRTWVRPGKNKRDGISATSSRNDRDRLYVFSTATPLPTEQPLSKFAVYAHLEHHGDYKAAAAALAAAGYGTPPAASSPLARPSLSLVPPSASTSPSSSEMGGSITTATVTVAEPLTGDGHRGQLRMAYRLASEQVGKLLHVHGLGWHTWDGQRWAEDRTGAAQRAVMRTLRRALSESLGGDATLRVDVGRCESGSGVSGVLSLAGALPAFAAAITDLDSDPYLLNCANGTLDLRTGELGPHNPADRITKVTRAAYQQDAPGRVFDAFLSRVLPDDDVRGFLQRVVGVALLGKVREHVLPILIGTGANGKGTLTNAVHFALGDYSLTAEADLFLHRPGAHPTGEMDLRGVRWVVARESDEGRQLAAATVKRLTGGDPIRARRMHKDFVEFTPSHTACLMTNHLPTVRGDDPAIWRRLRVVPFDVVIPAAEYDKHLDDKLAAEADAVLAWAVDGYREWSRRGDLDAPDAVLTATSAYRVANDALARFLADEDVVMRGEHHHARGRELWAAWVGWCSRMGEQAGPEKDFRAALERHGVPGDRTKLGRIYRGVSVVADDLVSRSG